MILMRNQSAGNFRIRFRRKDCLGAFTRISSPNAAYIERRAATVAFQCAVSLFSEEFFHSDGFFVFLLIERNMGDHFPFCLWHFFYVIVESGDGDSSVFICYFADYFAKYIDRISYRTSEVSRMQVTVRSGHFYFPVSQSAQTGGEGWKFGTQHAGIRNQDNVCFQQLFMLFAEGFQAGRADFLFSFEDKLDVIFQQFVLDEIFEGFDLDKGLSFVIIRSACPDVSVPYFGFEGLAFPQFQRFGRHYVVVGVDQYCFGIRVNDLLCENNRVTLGRHHQCFLHSGFEQ